MSGFQNQTAVITGSARGIGLAIAEALAEQGCAVVISDLNEDRCREAAERIARQYGVPTFARVCDVTSREENRELAEFALKEVGGLDIWINNAGILKDAPLVRMSEGDFDAVMDVNLKGAFLGIQAASRPMMKARAGRIINIGSVSGFYGNWGQANYSASKAGLNALTKSAARELAGRNVTVNCVAAGFVANDMTAHLPGEIRERLTDSIPLNKFADATRSIARAVRFLASPEADFITGTILRVDGGMLIGF